jgi:hypothetical protein
MLPSQAFNPERFRMRECTVKDVAAKVEVEGSHWSRGAKTSLWGADIGLGLITVRERAGLLRVGRRAAIMKGIWEDYIE